jgi:adenosine kinase
MVGNDAQDYLAPAGLGVDTRHIGTTSQSYTAQAMIMTDRDNNQITAFHPGAMSLAHENPVPTAMTSAGHHLARRARGHAAACRQLHAAGIPFVFDPGQGLPMFNGEELTSSSNWPPGSP